MNYKEVKIGDYTKLRQGLAINRETKCYLSNEITGISLLRIADMQTKSKHVYIKETVPKRFLADKEDIIYTRTGKVGLVFKGFEGVVHNNCFTVNTIDKSILNQEYLYYALKERSFFIEANARACGAAQPDLPHDMFKNINIKLPDVHIQKKIADILSAYDDLIENNQKQIKLLEEAAQRLYKEWFIDLHFPGYEDTKIVDGVPEGWDYIPLDETIDYSIGGGWGADYNTGNFTKPAFVIRGTDINSIKKGLLRNIPFRFHKDSNFTSRELREDDIIFEVSGGGKNEGVAKTLLMDKRLIRYWNGSVICASFCKLIRLKNKKMSNYIYDTFQYWRNNGITSKYDKSSASSIINYRWNEFITESRVLIPESHILKSYNSTSKDIYEKITALWLSIDILIESRDSILPKLMNGEIDLQED